MTQPLVHNVAWVTVILSWSLCTYLTIYWFVAPKLAPHYLEHVAPWLHPKAEVAWSWMKKQVTRFAVFVWQKTKDFFKSVMGW